MTPEQRVLLLCARTEPTADLGRYLRHERAVDWDEVVAMAGHHQVLPLVHHSLKSLASADVPASVRRAVHGHFTAIALRNLKLARTLSAVQSVLETNGIPRIFVKGPVLAATVYGDLALRQFSDLDVLVHPSDYPRVAELLLAEGSERTSEFDWQGAFAYGRGKVPLDVHHGLAPRQFPVPYDFEALMRRARSVTVADTRVTTLSPEDNLILLCLQIARDYWADHPQLSKFCDVAELLRATSRFDWDLVEGEAERLRLVRIVRLGIYVAQQLLQAPVPEIARRRLAPRRRVESLGRALTARLFAPPRDTAVRPFEQARIHFRLRERWRDGWFQYRFHLRPLVLRALVPNERDRSLLRLPPGLSGLYYLVRPLRLSWQYASWPRRRTRTSPCRPGDARED